MKTALLILGVLLPLSGMAASTEKPHAHATQAADDSIHKGLRIIATAGNKVPWVTVVTLENQSGDVATISSDEIGYYETNGTFVAATAFMTDSGDTTSATIPTAGQTKIRLIFRNLANKKTSQTLVQWRK